MKRHDLHVDTSSATTVDLTAMVEEFVRGEGDGLCLIFAAHATAGIALIETGAGSDGDLVTALERLLPRDERYLHHHGSAGHGADHLLPALISPSVVFSVAAGRLELGRWQRVVLVDLNSDNPQRTVTLRFLAG